MFNLLVLVVMALGTSAIRVPTGKEPYLSPGLGFHSFPRYSSLAGYSSIAVPPTSYQSFVNIVHRNPPVIRTLPVIAHGHLPAPYYSLPYH
ncbi:unnamed protein product [Nezara viridula]|uniref:Neuropeptide n=1 Tax=Nezara viridula TaxID=85310 RepID=A0A9P0HRH7_NEZVI|nr:unnamed protein product [Nezara viridula]